MCFCVWICMIQFSSTYHSKIADMCLQMRFKYRLHMVQTWLRCVLFDKVCVYQDALDEPPASQPRGSGKDGAGWAENELNTLNIIHEYTEFTDLFNIVESSSPPCSNLPLSRHDSVSLMVLCRSGALTFGAWCSLKQSYKDYWFHSIPKTRHKDKLVWGVCGKNS